MEWNRWVPVLAAGLMFLCSPREVRADGLDLSHCVWHDNLVCELYEDTPAGSGRLDLSSILPAGVQLVESYLILYEPGTLGDAQLDPANWSDIVQFWPTAVQLFSGPLEAALLDEVFTSTVKIALAEETGPPTEYTSGGAFYQIYGDVAPTPEPASIGLFGLMVVIVGGAYKLRGARR